MKIENMNELLENVNGGSFVGISTLTPVKLTGGKKNTLQGRITKKVTNSNVMMFTNKNTNAYRNKVKRTLEAEGKDPNSFVLSKRTWGKRLPESPLVEHKDNMYVEVAFNKEGLTTYLCDGKPIAKADIEGLPKQRTGKQGGLENKVTIKTYKLSSIVSAKHKGKLYV